MTSKTEFIHTLEFVYLKFNLSNYLDGIKVELFKRTLFTLSLMGLMFNNTQAAEPGFDFTVTPVAENVYSIIAPSYGRPSPENKGWNSNSHFIVTKEGVLVFDTGSSEIIGREIIKAIKSVTAQPVRWVINSHSHADHWLGNAAFADAGAKIFSTGPSLAAMKEDGQGDVDAFFRMTGGATGSSNIFYPNLLLAQREKRTLGGVDVEFIFSNDGHSPGDILMWLPKQNIIFGGDVLNSDWMPIMTPRGNVPNLINTLNTVIKLKPAIALTGHGKATTVKSVIRDARLLDSVWKLVKKGYDNGEKSNDILPQVISKLGPEYRALYKNFDSNSEYLVQMMYKKQE